MRDVNSIFSKVEFIDMTKKQTGNDDKRLKDLKSYDVIVCDEEKLLTLSDCKNNAIVATLKSKIKTSL